MTGSCIAHVPRRRSRALAAPISRIPLVARRTRLRFPVPVAWIALAAALLRPGEDGSALAESVRADARGVALVAFERARLDARSAVLGDVVVAFPEPGEEPGRILRRSRDARVDGSIRLSATGIAFPDLPWFEPGGRDVVVALGSSAALPPGPYGRVTVGSASGPPAVLALSGGVYDLVALHVGRESRVECAEECEIRIFTSATLDARGYVGPKRPDDGGALVHIFVAGVDSGGAFDDPARTAAVEVAEGARLDGRIYAPNGTLRLGRDSVSTGGVVARAVWLGEGGRIAAGHGETSSAVSTPAQRFRVASVDRDVREFRLEDSHRVRLDELFRKHAALLGLGPWDAMLERRVWRSADGRSHHRFAQLHRALPVFGAEFVVQEANGWVVSGGGRIVSGLDVSPVPAISESDAVGRVGGGRRERPLGFAPAVTLGVASAGGGMTPESFRLVYRVSVRGRDGPGGETVDVDARTGDIVNRVPRTPHYNGGGDTLHNGWKPFEVESFQLNGQTRYRLAAPDYIGLASSEAPVGITTVRALGLNPPAEPPPEEGFIFENYVVLDFLDEDGDFRTWPLSSFQAAMTQPPPTLYGVSIHWGLQQAVDYWRKVNWIGVDGEGVQPILGLIDCAELWGKSNAFFDAPGQFCFARLAHLQVVGHEFAHGVFFYSTGGTSYSGEAGIVNEGVADVFGHLLDPDAEKWCMTDPEATTFFYKSPGTAGSCNGGTALCPGEQCDPTGICSLTVPAKCMRSLIEPKSTGNPDTFQGVNFEPMADCPSDCHQDSTIVGHWFYVLANGKKGTNDHGDAFDVTGIGAGKAEQIVQRTLTAKIWGSVTFLGARAASVQAAEDLFGAGSPEVIAATNAWYAVGVGGPYDVRDYKPTKVSGVEPWAATLWWEQLDGETDWEAQVSPTPSFESETKDLGPQLSQATGIGNVLLGTTVNLKPVTTYYWRVRSKSSPPPATASVHGSSASRVPWLRPGRGRLQPAGGTSPPGSVMAVVPGFAANLLGDWGPWGDTQSFVTGPKVPVPITPAPLSRIAFPGSGADADATAPLSAPGLHYPWDADFRWKRVPGATQYRLTVSESADRSCKPTSVQKANVIIAAPSASHTVVDLVAAPTPAGPEVSRSIPLFSDRTYYWWLMAFGPGGIPGGCAYGGQPVRFQTSKPKASLTSPNDGAHVSAFETTLDWDDVQGAGGYDVQVAKGSPSFAATQSASDSGLVVQPGALATFYWRVRPRGPLSGDVGDFSAARSFVTELGPTKPTLKFPPQDFWAQYGTPMTFSWLSVPGATGYVLTIYRRQADLSPGDVVAQVDSGFAESPVGTGVQVSVDVDGVTTEPSGYCWKVQAKGPGGLTGVASDVWCYRTGATGPTILSPAEGATNVEYAPAVVTWSCPFAPGGYRVGFSEYSDGTGCGPETTALAPAGATSLAMTLAGGTAYCVTVMSLNGDGSDGHWDQVKFQTKPAPPPVAECKALNGDAVTLSWPVNYGTIEGGTIQLVWVEEDPSIAQYQIGVWSHVGGGSQLVWTSPPIPSASLQFGSPDARLYNVLTSVPGTVSTGALYGVTISARTDATCKTWSYVAVVDALYLDW